MKKIVQLNPLLIVIITYIPSLTLRLLSGDQAYSPIGRSTLFLLSSIWLTGCQTAWLWAVGVSLHTNLKLFKNRDLTIFKANLFIPLAYVILPLATLMGVLIPVNSLFPFLTFEFYNYLHTVSLICFIYPIYFIAKSLTAIEYKKPTDFGEYISTFLAIIIFPIGIFFVQPRIKKAVNSSITDYVKD